MIGPEEIHPKLLAQLGYAVAAVFGGAARYMEGYIKTGQFKVGLAVANIFVSAFSGLMFANFVEILGINAQAGFALAGVGGFIGGEAVKWLYEKLTS